MNATATSTSVKVIASVVWVFFDAVLNVTCCVGLVLFEVRILVHLAVALCLPTRCSDSPTTWRYHHSPVGLPIPDSTLCSGNGRSHENQEYSVLLYQIHVYF